jgi:hypothetical protein
LGRQLPERLKARASDAFSARDANRDIYEDCYEYYSPYKNTLTREGGTLNKPTRQYSSTAQISAAAFVNTMQREFTPPFSKWASLKAGPAIPDDQKQPLNEVLEKITDVFFSYLNSSNYASAKAESDFELGIGTKALWLYEGDTHPFNFVSSPVSEMGIAEGNDGRVDFRARKTTLKASLVKQKWKDATLPESLNIESAPDKMIEVMECFYFDYEDMLWRYDVIIDGECVFYTTHKEEICFTPRWMKVPKIANGFGPFVLALADVKTDNKLREFLLRAAALDVAGVYTVTNDGALNPNTLNIAPHTFIPVERNRGEAGPTIERLDTAANFQLQEYISQGLTDQIRKTLLDNRMPAETPQPKTAFEIAQRMREFQTDIGMAYGRIYFEEIIPMWKRGLSILAGRGLIDLPEGFTIDNIFVQVQIVSPIAQTQQAEEVQRFLQSYQMVQMINPQLAMTRYRVEAIPAWLTEMTGTPAKLLRSDAEAKEMENAMAQMAGQAGQAQEMVQ